MREKKEANDVNDLLDAKEEAKERLKKLTGYMLADEDLEMVAGGDGDNRDMNEALADIDGQTEYEDGFC